MTIEIDQYASDGSRVIRVDFFKQSGKWYTTEALPLAGWLPDDPTELAHRLTKTTEFEQFLAARLATTVEGQPRIRYSGMTAMTLDWNGVPATCCVPDSHLPEGEVLAEGFIVAVSARNSDDPIASHCEVSFGRSEFKLGLTREQACRIANVMNERACMNLRVALVFRPEKSK